MCAALLPISSDLGMAFFGTLMEMKVDCCKNHFSFSEENHPGC